MAGPKRTGAQILWESLVREGVTCVFGYPGGAILPAYDAMLDYPIRHVLVRHEQGAAHMADGYARATGQVGVAIATSGPGATNLVTGIATAMMDCRRSSASPARWAASSSARTPSRKPTSPASPCRSPSTTTWCRTRRTWRPRCARRSTSRARAVPARCSIDLTKDCQQRSCEFEWPEAHAPLGYRPDLRPGQADLDRAVEMIHAAKRPLILAGNGIINAGASDLVQRFAEHADIPIAMTLLGIGSIPASHPLNLGMMGMHGEAWVNTAIQEADLLIALGMRFDDRVTGNVKTYALNAKKIHVEIDRAEINKNIKVDVGLVGDVGRIVEDLMPRVQAGNRADWRGYIDQLKGDASVRDIQNLPDSGHLYAAHVIHDLWRETKGEAVVVTDVGQHQMWEAQYYKHDTPRSLITSGGLGTMGFALPAAIGAKIARPDAEVWVVVGDGGFQMTMAELATIAQENLDIKVAIINNGYLGMVRQWQEFFYERRYAATPLSSPDFVKLAEAFGLQARRVTDRAGVIPTVQEARGHKGTVVIDFRVEQEDTVYPMVPAGADLHAMIRRPSVLAETGADQ